MTPEIRAEDTAESQSGILSAGLKDLDRITSSWASLCTTLKAEITALCRAVSTDVQMKGSVGNRGSPITIQLRSFHLRDGTEAHPCHSFPSTPSPLFSELYETLNILLQGRLCVRRLSSSCRLSVNILRTCKAGKAELRCSVG